MRSWNDLRCSLSSYHKVASRQLYNLIQLNSLPYIADGCSPVRQQWYSALDSGKNKTISRILSSISFLLFLTNVWWIRRPFYFFANSLCSLFSHEMPLFCWMLQLLQVTPKRMNSALAPLLGCKSKVSSCAMQVWNLLSFQSHWDPPIAVGFRK